MTVASQYSADFHADCPCGAKNVRWSAPFNQKPEPQCRAYVPMPIPRPPRQP